MLATRKEWKTTRVVQLRWLSTPNHSPFALSNVLPTCIVRAGSRRRREMQFNEKKAAQVAAFFLHRARGELEILKLMKLMYLAERASYKKFGEPLIGDKLVSMDNGPVLSITLNHMNRFLP